MTANSILTGSEWIAGPSATLERAIDYLIGLQDPGGWWKANLETNVTMDAEDVLLRHIIGILEPGVAEASGDWIRSNQRDDGTWGTFYGSPPDLSTTVEAYVALRLAGDAPDAAHLARAAEWIRAHGGIEGCRVFTRIWLAMVGAWDWEDLPVVPAELMFLPKWVPFNIYDFGCWARQTVVALSVVMAHRPVRALPFGLVELKASGTDPTRPGTDGGRTRASWWTTRGRMALFDRLLHRYQRLPTWVLPRTVIRQAALRRAEQWIIRRQEADGCWGGIQPPLVYSVIALYFQGYGLEHPLMRAALVGMEGFIINDERGRRVEACQSPIWDTALAMIALSDAGVPDGDQAIAAATKWLIGQEVTTTGDWSVRRPSLAPGGWAFEFANVHYPDIDDTAEVVLALRRAGLAIGSEAEAACRRATHWTVGMQSRGGGWGAFDADNDRAVVAALPFCDFGKVIDPPSADVTAHVIEMLAGEPGVAPEVMARGIAWLSREQEHDGSWFGRWGVNYIYGTCAAVTALVTAGIRPDDLRIRRAVAWIRSHQNPDGGWGEDIRSYVDDAWRGRGASTASQTAWALMTLLAAGEVESEATAEGVAWLVQTQNAEGSWDEPWYTGTGFPWDFSINYNLYRLVWPLSALGRYVQLTANGAG